MFAETSNPYRFQYLQTAISGPGIQTVYLPEQPDDDEILFEHEDKFVRPEQPEYLRKATKEYVKNRKKPDFRSIYANELAAWEDREWSRSTTGIWFWNHGNATYITPFYYWYLTAWITYFGHPIYRETDKELTYFIQYCEEDPNCYGLLLNTIRRYGKSSIMGAYAVWRATRNFNHACGMQGEKNEKIADFYNKMIVKPFRKLPYYYIPEYDTASTQTKEIKFEKPVTRGKNAKTVDFNEDEELESVIDYKPSGEGEYDGYVLNTYICEEPGKTLTCNISERWKIVKPCLRKGRSIRGKAFMGTTVEFMDASDKGGKAYKKLFFQSDVDNRGKDGRTLSGLYACFLPGDTAYEDFLDEWGFPMRDQAKESLLLEREALKNNPKDYSDLIRKYPLYISEIFYISADKCCFNAQILQDRLAEINMSKTPFTSKGEFFWIGGRRFGKVGWRSNPVNGWAQVVELIKDSNDANLVGERLVRGVTKYYPKNQKRYASGLDPVDHRVAIDPNNTTNDVEQVAVRRSKPVLFVKRKYDSAIDGILTEELLLKRSQEKYPYKTNRHVCMMDERTYDPDVYNERLLMICWYYGCEVHVENQKPGTANFLHRNNCEMFLQQQYVPISVEQAKRINPFADGTAASPTIINEYTDLKSQYIEYFGHTICYRELLEDDLQFTPYETELFDYSCSGGWTEIACITKSRTQEKKHVDIAQLMPMYNEDGSWAN